MLTIISKFNNFRNRQGEYYTIEDLTKLSKAVITSDVIHFKGNISHGFNSTVANCIYKHIDKKYKNGKVLIINDLSLHMINKLAAEGFDISNIYLAYGKWSKNADLDKDLYVYETMKKHIEVSFKEKLNVIKLEDIFNMQFDLVIANPPYRKIGAQITKKIIDDVDYKEFINLLPANDYKRVSELWQYQSDMESCRDAFEDAVVTTHVAKLHKNKVNNMTAFQFDISVHPTHYLDKYFILNNDKYHYALDEARHEQDLTISTKTTYCFGHRDLSHGYLPFKGLNYRYNFIEDINIDYMIKNSSNDNYYVKFKTALEKQNFRDFLKQTNTGYLFFKLMCFELNVDSKFSASVFPKVDWTRSWTVEEILKEYNYTDEEIKEVMEDLKNFKGMND